MNFLIRILPPLVVLGVIAGFAMGSEQTQEDSKTTEISVKYFTEAGGSDLGGKAQTAVQESFYRQYPNIRLKPWSALRLPGNMWQQAELLAFAGGSAADFLPLFFHQVQFYASQGLLAPLDHLVAQDGGVQFQYWNSLPAAFRQAATRDGAVYAIPSGCFVYTLFYRREVFESAGLDPDNPPKTLEEFWSACQKLTDPELIGPGGEKLGRYALSSDDLLDHFMSFFFANGATLIEYEWVDPAGQVVMRTRLEDETPADAASANWKPRLIASFDSPQAREALRWMHQFRWAPWVRDAETKAIRNLTEEEAAVTPGVIRGVVRPVLTQNDRDRMMLLRRGRVALAGAILGSRTQELEQINLGICPFPPLHTGDASPSPLLPLMFGLNRSLVDNPERLKAAEAWLTFRTGKEAAAIENTVYAESGLARIISTWELRRSGMDSLRDALPPQWLKAQDYLFAGPNVVPYINGWTAIQQEIEVSVVAPMINSPTYDYGKALTAAARTANEKVLGLVPKETEKSRNFWALVALVVTVLALVIGGAAVFKGQLKQARSAAPRAALQPGTKQSRILAYSALLLGPALLLLAIFAYYPVGRGLIMAFQEYSLSGDSTFVGLRNFSEGLFASRFWIASLNTLIFVAINLGLGFLMPFLLAVLVSELPVGTATFRTIYFLPAVTAGLVVSLLWMRLYEPTEFGLLNQFVEPLFHAWNSVVPEAWEAPWPVRWLQDPKWAMLAVIVPTIWASAGPGSLIYLAALKSIPEEMYEAADLDGCSPWRKFVSITFPAIFPLLLINFIGAFIGTFQGMGQIFVMTGGGPNFATQVLALEIWQNAFLYLRFGVATAQAWILAATLIGAVVLQLRILERMDWRRAGS